VPAPPHAAAADTWQRAALEDRFQREYRCGSLLHGAGGREVEALYMHLRAALAERRLALDAGLRASLLPVESESAAKREPKPLRIVIYCNEYGNAWFPRWGPRSPELGGAGGSEEAAIFISRELAALGHRVEVYADPPEQDWGVTPASGGAVWLPLRAFDPDEQPGPDLFVSWRYLVSMALARGARRKLLWLHGAFRVSRCCCLNLFALNSCAC
jgi:hypothetical protein